MAGYYCCGSNRKIDGHWVHQIMNDRLLILPILVAFLFLCERSHGGEQTDRDEAIRFLVEAVGIECTDEHVDQLNLPKDQCDERFRYSINYCEPVAVSNLPSKLSSADLNRLMLRFSLCRGMLLQGQSFDLEKWEPTITQLVRNSREAR